MSDELKPVNCGCGGEANIYTYEARWKITEDGYQRSVGCLKCGIATQLYDTEAKAVEAWNRAMGKQIAIVKNFGHPCGTYGYCSNCGGYCVNEEPYCSHCGAKVEWE